MVCSNLKFGMGHNIPFSKKNPKNHGLIAHGLLSKQAQNRLSILTHNLKGLSKHSENTLLDQWN